VVSLEDQNLKDIMKDKGEKQPSYDGSEVIVHVHNIFSVTCVIFLYFFCNKTLLFNSFSCLVVCRVINEEKREMNRFIQLNIKIQRSSKSR